MWSLNQFPRENNRVASLTHTHHFTRSLWNCKIIQIQVVNVSLCISISQVPKYTSYSRRIVPYSHWGTSSTSMNHKIFKQTAAGCKHYKHGATFEAPLYLLLGWGVHLSFLILIINPSRFNGLTFLLKCDQTRVVAYVPLLGRIRSSRSSADITILVALIFT